MKIELNAASHKQETLPLSGCESAYHRQGWQFCQNTFILRYVILRFMTMTITGTKIGIKSKLMRLFSFSKLYQGCRLRYFGKICPLVRLSGCPSVRPSVLSFLQRIFERLNISRSGHSLFRCKKQIKNYTLAFERFSLVTTRWCQRFDFNVIKFRHFINL